MFCFHLFVQTLYILTLGSVGCKWKCCWLFIILTFYSLLFFSSFFFFSSPFLLVMKYISEVLDSECTSDSDSFVFVFAKRDGQSCTFSG